MKTNRSRLLILLGLLGGLCVSVSAQTAAPATAQVEQTETVQQQPSDKAQTRTPQRRPAQLPAKVTVMPGSAQALPQVVTIVHRLSGLKMLRLVMRQAGERGTLATIDPQAITSDAHASIIAGWTLDDGKTIAARLPQAAAEIEMESMWPFDPLDKNEKAAATLAAEAGRASVEPDLTVITSDGRKLRVHYVGLDGLTGLSLLQINGPVPPARAGATDVNVVAGQRVSIFAPERAEPEGEASLGHIYVRVGEIDGTIADVTRAKSGKLEGLSVRSAKLSPAAIGGIACDEAGNTLGIVEDVVGSNARVVPADTVREAAQRLLARQGSVPRPLLGVRGEPVEFASAATFLANGWKENQFTDLMKDQSGILLTWVLPGSPAADAKLAPGDVIVQVNQEMVKSAEEFSKLLGNAGPGADVLFTVARPGATTPFSISTKLGGSFEPQFEYRFDLPKLVAPRVMSNFGRLGIETMLIEPQMATQLGARAGVLVVTVRPGSLAARGGIREGDVIESIDGRPVGRGAWGINLSAQKKHVVSIVRDKEKKQIVLEVME
jgi:S1-C subfamily serine protease